MRIRNWPSDLWPVFNTKTYYSHTHSRLKSSTEVPLLALRCFGVLDQHGTVLWFSPFHQASFYTGYLVLVLINCFNFGNLLGLFICCSELYFIYDLEIVSSLFSVKSAQKSSTWTIWKAFLDYMIKDDVHWLIVECAWWSEYAQTGY